MTHPDAAVQAVPVMLRLDIVLVNVHCRPCSCFCSLHALFNLSVRRAPKFSVESSNTILYGSS